MDYDLHMQMKISMQLEVLFVRINQLKQSLHYKILVPNVN